MLGTYSTHELHPSLPEVWSINSHPFSRCPWLLVAVRPLRTCSLEGLGSGTEDGLLRSVSCGSLFLCGLGGCMLAGRFGFGFVCLQGR